MPEFLLHGPVCIIQENQTQHKRDSRKPTKVGTKKVGL